MTYFELIEEYTQRIHAYWIQDYNELKTEFLKLQESYTKAKQDLENHKSILPNNEIYKLMNTNIINTYERIFKSLEIRLITNISNQLYDPLSGKILIPKDIKKIIKQKKVLSYEKIIVLFSIDVSSISVEIFSKYVESKKANKELLANNNMA